MNNTTYIGIDPGLNGGICIIKNGDILHASEIPLIVDKAIDYKALWDIIFKYTGEGKFFCCIEKVHGMAHWGIKNNFSFGGYFNSKKAILQILEIPYIEIQPKKWQTKMFEGVKRVPGKDGKCDTKKTAELAVRKLYPSHDFRKSTAGPRTKKFHDGIVDAVLIARYASVNF